MDIIEFRTQFKKIVYKKGLISKANDNIRVLSRFDRNGSHQKAILKAIGIKESLQIDFKQMINGLTYEDWLQKSKQLSILTKQFNSLIKKEVKIQEKINELLSF